MFCFAKQKLLITSDNSVYLVTAFIQKPPPIFCSATLRKTSDIRGHYIQLRKAFYFDGWSFLLANFIIFLNSISSI